MRVGTEMEGRRQLVVFFLLSFLITIQLETVTIFFNPFSQILSMNIHKLKHTDG